MRRLGLGVLLAVLTAGTGLSLHSRLPDSCKPTPPIDLDVQLIGDPASPFGVTARATSRTGDEVDLEILVPDGVDHLSGQRKLKGRRCEARVDLRARDRARREILVRASFTRGGATMSRVASLVLFDAPEPAKGVRKNSRAGAILELSP